MAFAIEEQEDVSDSIRRIVAERIDKALEVLRHKDGTSLGEVVHSARKRFKEVRAALRLVREELGSKVFDEENQTFRDAGRPLSDLRDAYVLVDALDDLAKRGGDGITPATLRPLRKTLLERRRDVRRRVINEEGAMERVASTLEAARGRVKDWPLHHGGWNAIGPGLRKTYGDGRDAMEQAVHDGSDEAFHEWRKRVKDLRYHLEILQPIWPGVMEALANEAHTLADQLGEDHDLTVLREIMLERPNVVKRTDAAIKTIQERQDKLRSHAKAVGRRLYTEKPKAFAGHIEEYWEAFRKG